MARLPLIPGLTRTTGEAPASESPDTSGRFGLETLAGRTQAGASSLVEQAKSLLQQAAAMSPALNDIIERVVRILDMASTLESRRGGMREGSEMGGMESPSQSEFSSSSPLESLLRR